MDSLSPAAAPPPLAGAPGAALALGLRLGLRVESKLEGQVQGVGLAARDGRARGIDAHFHQVGELGGPLHGGTGGMCVERLGSRPVHRRVACQRTAEQTRLYDPTKLD